MTQTFNSSTQTQAGGALSRYYTPSDAETLLAEQFAVDQPLADQVANFNLFTTSGAVDGPGTLQAQSAVLAQVIYLTVAAIKAYGVNVGYFDTTQVDWTATKTQRLSFRLSNYGF